MGILAEKMKSILEKQIEKETLKEQKAALILENPEKADIIRLFFCDKTKKSSKPITLQNYQDMLKEQIDQLHIKQRSIQQLDVDPADLNNMEMVEYEGYIFNKDKENLVTVSENNQLIGTQYTVGWLLFGKGEFAIYQYSLNTISNNTTENLTKYIFRDIKTFEIFLVSSSKITVKPSDKQNKLNYEKVTVKNYQLKIATAEKVFVYDLPESESLIAFIEDTSHTLEIVRNARKS